MPVGEPEVDNKQARVLDGISRLWKSHNNSAPEYVEANLQSVNNKYLCKPPTMPVQLWSLPAARCSIIDFRQDIYVDSVWHKVDYYIRVLIKSCNSSRNNGPHQGLYIIFSHSGCQKEFIKFREQHSRLRASSSWHNYVSTCPKITMISNSNTHLPHSNRLWEHMCGKHWLKFLAGAEQSWKLLFYQQEAGKSN